MKKNKLLLLFSFGIFFMFQMTQSSCTNDTLPEDTSNPVCDTLQVAYNLQVKSIIDNSCAFSGCHFTGAPIGDYTSYSGMSSILNDTKFKRRVIDLQDMPVAPTTLTTEEYEILECWVASNYPEN